MRILQENLYRSRTADALLEQLRLDKGADLLIISEQYRNRDGPGWYVDTLETAAIWIPDLHRVFVKSHGVGKGFVWVKCDDTTYVGCYFTPNESIHDFRNKFDQLENTIRELEGVLIVAGDFNARALEWGMDATDARGRYLLEMATNVGLTVVNEGSTPTFRRPGCVGKIPDTILVSDVAAQSVLSWMVVEDYTGNDQQYITYTLRRERTRSRWNVGKLNEDALLGVVEMR